MGVWWAPRALADTPGPPGQPRDESRGSLQGENGLAVTIGIGAMDFLGRAAREALTDGVGLYGDLRVVYRTRRRLAVEAGFTRSQRQVLPGWVRSSKGWLFGQGFEASLRLNHPHPVGRVFMSPFVVAGLGWTDFSPPDDRDPMTRARRIDRAGIIPLGGGFAASIGNLYGELRFVYRPTFSADLFGPATTGGPSMQAWFAGIAGGVEL